jgi:hypothetical protein
VDYQRLLLKEVEEFISMKKEKVRKRVEISNFQMLTIKAQDFKNNSDNLIGW